MKNTTENINQETITRKSLKKEFSSRYRITAITKPFHDRECLLCGTKFPKKVKAKKDKKGVRYYTCTKCGLTHYNAMNFPEILLVSRKDEEKYRGLLTFQKQTLLYASDEELENYNNGNTEIEPLDEKQIIQKESMTMVKTDFGQSPIYEGADE